MPNSPLSASQRLGHLDVQLAELSYWSVRGSVDLAAWTFNGEPLVVGQAWPERSGVACLEHPRIDLPVSWAVEDSQLDLELGGEGLVRVLYPDGSQEQFGHDPNHQHFPLRGRELAVRAEVVARLPFGVPNRAAALTRARLIWWDDTLVRFLRRLRLLRESATALETDEVAEPLLRAAERAIARLLWPSATDPYLARLASSPELLAIWELPAGLEPDPAGLSDGERQSVADADAWLTDVLRELKQRYPPRGRLALTGQGHLDLAWLWPMDETRRKAQRTFSSMLALLDRYPEFIFHQTTAQVYQFLEQDDPDLFARIKQKVAEGRWDPVGGMWVEPDMNMIAGESIARQLLYGQRYFERAFGRRHTVCYLPDCFGFSPALPQLLRLAGIDNFFTIKLTWSETNRFPYDLFWWEGIDGSRVLAHMFDNPGFIGSGTGGYNGSTNPAEAQGTWQSFRGKHIHPESLLSIGYGDGGGGVTAEMLDQARDLAGFPTLPEQQFALVGDFFTRLQASVVEKEIPLWVGELYLELHRGTLSTQGRTKRLHRQAERALVAAEALGGMAALLGAEIAPSLEPSWRMLLRNQFHDILPGSSIREVYQTTERELAEVIARTESLVEQATTEIARRLAPTGTEPALLLVNPDLSARPLRCELDSDHPGAQRVDGGFVLAGEQTIPGLGASVVPAGDSTGSVRGARNYLENRTVRVELDDEGGLRRVHDKENDRDVLVGRGNQLWAYVDRPRAWDAWDVDADYGAAGEEIDTAESVDLIESGPHRAAVRVVRRFRHSRIQQEIRLWSNSSRVEFHTTLDWHNRHWLLKARFPLAIRSATAIFETAFGVVERSTHRNTSWEATRFEVAGHRFAVLAEPGYGTALLNDGKYGHDVLGNELSLTLLRSPLYPDPRADEGRQSFSYALFPYSGSSWLAGGVLMEAEDLNRPLTARPMRASEPQSWQAVCQQGGPPLALGALKPAEDGAGLVLRLYEPQGMRGSPALSFAAGWSAIEEVDLLEQRAGPARFDFSPFQVRSWLLRPKGA